MQFLYLHHMEQKFIELSETLLEKMSDATYSKQFADIKAFARKTAEFLSEYFSAEELERLVKEAGEVKAYRSYVYEDCCGVFKHHVVVECRDYKITFIVTEEKRDIEWVVTDIQPGTVWIPT